MVQASKEEIGPVLLVHDSAGFVSGLDADASLATASLDNFSEIPSPELTIFTSTDAALSASLRHEGFGGRSVMVLVDSWDGHDPALRNFTLLFLNERLTDAGAGPVAFLITEPDLAAPAWEASLIVHHAELPLPPLAPRPPKPVGARTAGLLLDPEPDLSAGLIDWAATAFRDAGAAVRLIPGPGVTLPDDLPPILHVVTEADTRSGWLMRHLDLLAGRGFHGWKHRLGSLARQSGVPTADLGAPGGRSAAIGLLTRPPAKDTQLGANAPSLADWFLAQFRTATRQAAT